MWATQISDYKISLTPDPPARGNMIKLFCAIVDTPGAAFSVRVDESDTVDDLKDAIKAKNPATVKCDVKDLRLFLAKKGGAWLPSSTEDVKKLKKGVKTALIEALTEEDQELQAEDPLNDVLSGMDPPLPRQIHVLVVAPQGVSRTEVCDMIRDGRGIRKFNEPLGDSELEYEGGVPATFKTLRKATVAAFASLLDRIPVIFIRAPLCPERRPCAIYFTTTLWQVYRVFKFLYGYEFEAFCAHKGDRVVLIDEAQITYNDEQLWRGYVKGALESQIRGLRFVLFSSYGSFNIYRKFERAGTPILVPPQNTFGLNATPYKPGLQLSREELKEMAQNSIGISASDLIWILCSGHIGIARAILIFLHRKFGSGKPNDEDVELELRSLGLLQEIRSSYRGIPSADAFERVKDANNLPDEAVLKMIGILNGVASGKVMLVSDGHRTPRSQFAAELLTRYGFLYEDQAGQLQFASSMHLKIWLYSNRTDPISYMVSDVAHEDFVVACVQRMSALRLQNFANENTNGIARERQIQMELYGATVSCLPRDVLVTPEWRTTDGKGYIDLMIRGSSILWFWELLVNGDDAVGHSNRFETGGKYHGSLTGSSKYVLIDFRQSKGVRYQKHGFLYVSFVDSYTKALVFSTGKSVVSVKLLS
ncbi:hypothetical protein Plhal703r1_c23g0097491 [Plasmopara halstedii]